MHLPLVNAKKTSLILAIEYYTTLYTRDIEFMENTVCITVTAARACTMNKLKYRLTYHLLPALERTLAYCSNRGGLELRLGPILPSQQPNFCELPYLLCNQKSYAGMYMYCPANLGASIYKHTRCILKASYVMRLPSAHPRYLL